MAHRLARDAHAPDRGEIARLFELIGLCAFAVGQPVLNTLGNSPETFVFHRIEPTMIILFGVAWMLVPPVALWLVGLATLPLGAGIRRTVHRASIWGLLSIIVFQVAKHLTSWPGQVVLPLGVVAGWAGGVLLTRVGAIRGALRFSAMAAPPFLLGFLLLSPASALVLPQDVEPRSSAPRSDPTPVVFVVFDQLPTASLMDPSGRIDRRRHPNLARFADDATWYRHFTAASFHTRWALPAILTGKDVVYEKRHVFREHPDNLFTLLARTHEMRVFERYTKLCPRDLCGEVEPAASPQAGTATRTAPKVATRTNLRLLLRDSALAWWDISAPYRVDRDPETQFTEETVPAEPPAGETEGRPGPGRVISAWSEFLGYIGPTDRPALYFAHIGLPHFPWRYLPSGRSYDPLKAERAEWKALDLSRGPVLLSDDQWPMQLQRQRHLLQVQYVDGLLGLLVQRLEEADLYDRSLIVVTSDHGLLSGVGTTEENLFEILWMPLLIKTPGQTEGQIDDSNMSAVDLLPTLADLLGTPLPWSADGASVLAPHDRGTLKRFDNPETPDVNERWKVNTDRALQQMRRSAFVPAVQEPDDALLLYRIGPRPHLIGEPIDRSMVGPPSSLRASLDNAPGAFAQVDLRSGSVPAFVTGSLRGAGEGELLAFVLNGRVAGVSPTYSIKNRTGRFSLLIPESLFRQGENRVELFLIEGSAYRPVGQEER